MRRGWVHCSLKVFGALEMHLSYCIQFWAPQFKKDMEEKVKVQWRATRKVRDRKHVACEGWWRGPGLFSWAKRWLRDDILSVYNYLKERSMK